MNSGFSIVGIDGQKFAGLKPTRFGWQFSPHLIKGEGFFIAVLQKNDGNAGNIFGVSPASFVKSKKSGLVDSYLSRPELFTETIRNNITFAIPLSAASEFEHIEKRLYIRQAGIAMGEYKGKDFLPTAGLSLSNHLRKNLPAIDVEYNEAIAYLRGESPPVKAGDRGWYLVQYKKLNLGWIKALGTRANNYYPREWRILKREHN